MNYFQKDNFEQNYLIHFTYCTLPIGAIHNCNVWNIFLLLPHMSVLCLLLATSSAEYRLKLLHKYTNVYYLGWLYMNCFHQFTIAHTTSDHMDVIIRQFLPVLIFGEIALELMEPTQIIIVLVKRHFGRTIVKEPKLDILLFSQLCS